MSLNTKNSIAHRFWSNLAYDKMTSQIEAVPSPSLDTTQATEVEQDAWEKYLQVVLDHEREEIKQWRDEIDTLLVFAGLFSAVLTAFNVQYYPELKSSSTAQPSTAAVVINALWFLALVLSLAAASIGISAKQWLSHYMVPNTVTVIQRLRVWHLRHQSFQRWHVPEIIEVLPLLLQLSLAAFLTGIAILLWTLHRAVAAIVIAPMGTLLLFTIWTVITPSIVNPGCPYKSPQARWIYLLSRYMTLDDGVVHLHDEDDEPKDHSGSGPQKSSFGIRHNALPVNDWLGREDHWIHTVAPPFATASTDLAVAVDTTIQNDDFLQVAVLPALTRVDAIAAYKLVSDIVCSRAHIKSLDRLVDPWSGTAAWFQDEVNSKTIVTFADLTMVALHAVSEHSYALPRSTSLSVGSTNPYPEDRQRRVERLLALLNHLLQGFTGKRFGPFCEPLAKWFVHNRSHLSGKRISWRTREYALWLVALHWDGFNNAYPQEHGFHQIVTAMLQNRREDAQLQLQWRSLEAERRIAVLATHLLSRSLRDTPKTTDANTLATASSSLPSSVAATNRVRTSHGYNEELDETTMFQGI
ncbi:uncharacterized protein B0H18DRAFT_1123234 [Fomitopsis serialis]|uniref:uncharacterized protein n=1 Tax=Fomitopsis serialis TaxID=139415 RepID=UPI002007463F|nr:uncharacterized protein B0H18DRAFT_1123234 [Neoantrodia serialis]KAH9918071.1 hypothetical protein B0H18DRAFT_1123234 [Neoantrodia serialis]